MTAETGGEYFELKRELFETAGSPADVTPLFDNEAIRNAKRIYPLLRDWARRYPIILERRLVSMCLDSVTMCQKSSTRTMLQSAVLCLVLFAIDDLADGTIVSLGDDDVHALLQLYTDITSDPEAPIPESLKGASTVGGAGPSAHWRQVARAHREMCLDLARGSTPGSYAIFAEYFNACMHEMRTECRWRRAFIDHDDIPTLDDYMRAAERSIGAPAVWGALFPLDGYPIDAPVAGPRFQSLKALCDEIVFAGARCIRLANDARSYGREILYEKKPNSILILMRRERMSEQEAETFVAQWRERSQKEMLELTELLPGALFEWGQSVRRFCDSIKKWYLVMELHDAPAEMNRLLTALSAD